MRVKVSVEAVKSTTKKQKRARAKHTRAKPSQLTFDDVCMYDGSHGGKRPGAGRPKGRKALTHDARPRLAAYNPVHVTLRLVDGIPSLRSDNLGTIVRHAIHDSHRRDFRLTQFCILSNHIHLIVEADGARPLTRGMQGLAIRIARRLNRYLGRRGKLFATRYHARALKTPMEVRNALRYVLLNARHHAAQGGYALPSGWIDPFSSAAWFDGWRELIEGDADGIERSPRPTSLPRVWLLRTGWRRHGLLSIDDEPGKRSLRAS